MWPRRIESKVDRLHEDLVEIRDEQRFAKESLRRLEIALGENTAILVDMRDEMRSQTRAILSLIDRLDGGGGATPAGGAA